MIEHEVRHDRRARHVIGIVLECAHLTDDKYIRSRERERPEHHEARVDSADKFHPKPVARFTARNVLVSADDIYKRSQTPARARLCSRCSLLRLVPLSLSR